MSKFWILILAILLAGCGFNATRNISPEGEAEAMVLLRTKGIATTKDNISIVVVPLHSVKKLDGFGILIINESTHWISFRKEECMLVQGRKVRRPVADKQISAHLGGSYRPTMPTELSADLFEWRRSVNLRGTRDAKIVDEDKKVSIMGGTKQKIYLYFSTQGDMAPMQLIIPNIYNEATKKRTRFSFKFNVEKS